MPRRGCRGSSERGAKTGKWRLAPRQIVAHQRDVRRRHGHVGTGTHGKGHIGRRQCRCVVDPVSRHANALPPQRRRFTASALPAGVARASKRATPASRAMADAVPALSPVIMTTSMPMARILSTAAREPAGIRSECDQTQGASVARDRDDAAPGRLPEFPDTALRSRTRPTTGDPAITRAPPTRPLAPCPRHRGTPPASPGPSRPRGSGGTSQGMGGFPASRLAASRSNWIPIAHRLQEPGS